MMNDKEAIEDIYKRYKNIDPNDKFFKKKIRQRNPYFRSAAVILCIVLLSSSITIGNNFFNYRSKNKIGYLDEGLYTAIANNYMQNITMEYQKSNDIGVKVTNVLMDSSKIYLVFDFEFYEPLTENVHLLELPNMIIYNENKNILYCDDNSIYKNFCKEHNLNCKNETYPNLPIYNSNYSSQFIEKSKEHIRYLFVLTCNNELPISKSLYIDFSDILLYNNLNTFGNDTDKITEKTGNWNLEINLENKNTSNSPSFTCESNEYISNVNLVVGETCSYLEMNKETEFILKNIEILDNENNSYLPQTRIGNALKITEDKITAFLPLNQNINLNNLRLHISSDIFEKDFNLKIK